jgi:hypothetical protein
MKSFLACLRVYCDRVVTRSLSLWSSGLTAAYPYHPLLRVLAPISSSIVLAVAAAISFSAASS